MFLFEQFLAEGLIVHAGGPDVRKGIKSAAWLKSREAEAVESRHEQPAAAVIFHQHFLNIWLAAFQCFERGILRDGWRGHNAILVDAHETLDQVRRPAGVADAPARHGVIL